MDIDDLLKKMDEHERIFFTAEPNRTSTRRGSRSPGRRVPDAATMADARAKLSRRNFPVPFRTRRFEMRSVGRTGPLKAFVASSVLAGVAAGCATTSISTPPRAIPSFELRVATVQGLGRILVDGAGLTLYLYEPDHEGPSTCKGFCAEQWPPLVLPTGIAHPKAAKGVVADLLGTTKRSGGALQVTYAGWPLYRWQGDHKPGEALGEGDDMGLWYVVSPEGKAVLPR